LTASTLGTDDTTTAAAALLLKTNKTLAAETAVATQRARVELLVTAKADQTAAAALWAERVTAAEAVRATAASAKTAKETLVTEATE
jgi:hypothetical protein